MAKRYTVKKYDGDDMYSWAVFRKGDLPKGHRGIVFYGMATPVMCGLSRDSARHVAAGLEAKEKR
jgi:hypothetical protein